VKPRQWGGRGPLGALEPWQKKKKDRMCHFVKMIMCVSWRSHSDWIQ
jgi:hypothetical protein